MCVVLFCHQPWKEPCPTRFCFQKSSFAAAAAGSLGCAGAAGYARRRRRARELFSVGCALLNGHPKKTVNSLVAGYNCSWEEPGKALRCCAVLACGVRRCAALVPAGVCNQHCILVQYIITPALNSKQTPCA